MGGRGGRKRVTLQEAPRKTGVPQQPAGLPSIGLQPANSTAQTPSHSLLGSQVLDEEAVDNTGVEGLGGSSGVS